MKKKSIYLFLSLAMVTTISYFIFSVANSTKLINQLTTIVSVSAMAVFSVFFVIISMNNKNPKTEKYIILGSLLLTFYSSFNILTNSDILKLPTQNSVLNFTNKTVTEAIKWAKSNDIEIEQVYENSDNYQLYKIISQNIEPGTLLKEIDKLTVIVSNGPSLEKEIMIPSFIGWTFKEVMNFIDTNYLNNVDVSFDIATNPKDTVISQEGSGYLKRNDLIKINFSIGSKDDIVPTEIEEFSGKSLFYTTTWLKRYGFSYEISYDYSDKISKNNVISQNISGKVADPSTDKITLVISKGLRVKVVDLLKMNVEEITDWIIKNNLKITFEDKYDENIKLGYPISVNYKENDYVEEGTTIKVVLSKGQIKMPKITNISEFKNWVSKYAIKYEEVYEFNDKVDSGNIIKSSHEENSIIKNEDTVVVYISQGNPVTLPNFVGMNKSAITSKCNDLGITCNFVYGGLTETTAKDIATSQSKTKGSQIVKGTSVSVTLSSGIYVKVSVPSFVGMSKSTIASKCSSLKVTCSFSYQSNFSSTPKDQAISQSKSGTMNQGSAISVVLSKGPARVYNITIDGSLLTVGNAEATKNTLQSRLSNACPGVTFIYSFKDVMTGIGYINVDSDVKTGSNTLVEGNTYKVIINR